MYASKRTIGKQGLYTAVTPKKSNQPKHTNRPNGNGRLSYAQTIFDDKKFAVKTIYHQISATIFHTKRRKRRLRKSMSNQPK